MLDDALPPSIDGEPLSEDKNLDQDHGREGGDINSEGSQSDATLVDSAATSVVEDGVTAACPPGCSPGIPAPATPQAPVVAPLVGLKAEQEPDGARTSSSAPATIAGMLGYLEQKIDARIGEVEARLTSALSGALHDITSSQSAMIARNSEMKESERMHEEAAHQRDAHGTLAARVDAMTLQDRPARSSASGQAPISSAASPPQGLPVPSTPPRAFRPQAMETGGDTVMGDIADDELARTEMATPVKKSKDKSRRKDGIAAASPADQEGRPAGVPPFAPPTAA